MCSDFLNACIRLLGIKEKSTNQKKWQHSLRPKLYMAVYICSKPVMRSWCMQCLFLPGFGFAASSIRKSNCGPQRHIRLSVKHWEVCWRHLLCCSPGPTHETWLKCQKVLAWVKLFDVTPSPRWRRLKYCMVMQLHVLFFNFHSCLLWQISELGVECSGMRKRFNMRSHLQNSGCWSQHMCESNSLRC